MAPVAARHCLVAGILIVSALGQDATPTVTFTASGSETLVSKTTAAAPSSAITSKPSASSSSTANVPFELWNIANSLISSYYPSTSITQIDSLTWPATVVIGGATRSVHPVSTSSPAASTDLSTSLSNNKPAATDVPETPKEGPKHQGSDRKLGIALGVVFGLLALAIVGLILFCVHRRKKRHGDTGVFRYDPSVSDSEIGQWREPRLPEMGTVATATGQMSPVNDRPSREWLDRYNRFSHQRTPPAHLHPAFAYRNNGGVTPVAEDNPFFTPAERSTLPLEHYHDNHDSSDSSNYQDAGEYHPGNPDTAYHGAAGALSGDSRCSRSLDCRSSSSARPERDSRPPTPFSPMLMMQGSSKPRQNPFESPKDDGIAMQRRQEEDEEHDVVSPVLPTKSPQRRHSPMVHYPSWSEVSEFDFSGESEGTSGRGRSIRDRSSASSGDDGYRRERESIIGRSELA